MEDNKNKKVPNVPTLRFPEFSGEWKLLPFVNLYKIVKINEVINKNQYLKVGNTPIIDQGNELICGYSNQIGCKLPTIVYGDHTTYCKYIDFEFLVGSDGTKSLRSKNDNLFNLHFLYYCLLKNNLASEGYKRHFPILKTKNFYITTNKLEQTKIANFLSLIDKRIELQNKIIKDYELLKKLLMNKFLSNFNLREISIYSLVKSQLIRIIKASELKKFNGTKSYLSTSSIDENGSISPEKEISFFDRPSRASMIPYRNSVWFARMKDTNKVYISKNNDEEKYILSTGFYGILPIENDIDPIWLFEIFKSKYFIVQKDKLSEGGTMSGIKDSQLNELNIKIWLDKEMQNFACKLLKSFTKIIEIELGKENSLIKLKSYLLKTLFI